MTFQKHKSVFHTLIQFEIIKVVSEEDEVEEEYILFQTKRIPNNLLCSHCLLKLGT